MKTTTSTHWWHTPAAKFAKEHDSSVAIDPRSNPKTWEAWRNYFRWLNWAPWSFIEVERCYSHSIGNSRCQAWTAPARHPDEFGVSFRPLVGVMRPVFPLERQR